MSKNTHPIDQEELMAYLDGELTPERAAAAVAHLEHCQECQRLAADLNDVSQILMAWQVESSVPRMMQNITVALDERRQEAAKPGAFRRRKWQSILGEQGPVWIAGGLVVVGLFLVIGVDKRNSKTFDYVAHSIPGDSSDRGSAGKLGPKAQHQDTEYFYRQGLAKRRLKEKSDDSVDIDGSVPQGPMIIRTADLTLVTKDFDKARVSIEEILKRYQGYMGDLKISGPVGDRRTLTASLRIPADQLDSVITELRGLGRLEAESQSGEEVTAQYVDLEARLVNAKNTEQRLTDLLRQRTGKLADVLAVEVEIGRVRGEIERMEAERKNLAKQVAYATVNATITEDYKAQLQVLPPSTTTRFRNAAVEGYRTMVDSIVSVLVFLFSSGPSLLLWGGLLFFPARGLWRMLRRTPPH